MTFGPKLGFMTDHSVFEVLSIVFFEYLLLEVTPPVLWLRHIVNTFESPDEDIIDFGVQISNFYCFQSSNTEPSGLIVLLLNFIHKFLPQLFLIESKLINKCV